MGAVELRLPADVAYVGLARLVVTVAARQAGMVDERIEDLKIAVSEATTNAIVAHQSASPGEPVVLTFGADEEGSFHVTIADTGPGFEPRTPEELAQRDWTLETGLGVTLIRGMADDVRFIRGHGMQVDMSFQVGLNHADLHHAGDENGQHRSGRG